MAKLLIAHGGAATAVINASLYGAVTEALAQGVDEVLGALHGSAGILGEAFCSLGSLSGEALERLRLSPASAIGTSRTPLQADDYPRMAEILHRHGITHVLFTGGNGSMDTCGKLAMACKGLGILVGGIPKTIDNDIAVLDHAPGYGSAARFAAMTMAEIAMDVRSLPIHVCIVEYMGRNSGWITAASALARERCGDAPQLILLPEVPFEDETFLRRVQEEWDKGHGVVVAVSEGIRYADGTPVAPPVFTSGRATYFGDVSSHLTRLVIEKLHVKARCEKPGILGRCCPEMASEVDRAEAVQLGRLAARTVLSGQGGMMSGLRRLSSEPYRCEETLIPLSQVMLHERLLPDVFIAPDRYDVTGDFLQWARPLIGGPLPRYTACMG
ncbi:MAG: diphosphate--fructose-6-phosphate 1-phosphotransferase [Aristaeellaceae bacterium]